MEDTILVRLPGSSVLLFEREITDIGKKINRPDLFECAYNSCIKKQSFLFASKQGFLILRPKGDGVLAWIAHTFTPVDREDIQRQIEVLCKKVNIKFIEIWTHRKGYRKVLPALGYEQTGCQNNIDIWVKSL